MDKDENDSAEELSGDDSSDIENGGISPGDAEEQGDSEDSQGIVQADDPISVKKRLGMQAKKHKREMRTLHERIAQLQSHMMGDSANPQNSDYNTNPYPQAGQPNPANMSEEDKITHAVRMALGMKDAEQRQAEEAERQSHIHKQYHRLNDEFDRASDKYEDFDDIVRGDDIPFTNHVRDALLLVENPAEVAYRLGKNRSELERISKLHPLDQAREVNKLSFSLMHGKGEKPHGSNPAPIGAIRTSNANFSQAVTDKTPPSVIRARMKAGTWK